MYGMKNNHNNTPKLTFHNPSSNFSSSQLSSPDSSTRTIFSFLVEEVSQNKEFIIWNLK